VASDGVTVTSIQITTKCSVCCGFSLTVFALQCTDVPDGQTQGIGLAKDCTRPMH